MRDGRLTILLVVTVLMLGCTGTTSEELYADGVRKLRDGNASGAIVLLRSALDKDQNLPDARYQLAKAYLEAGKYELAEKEFQKVKRLTPNRPGIQLDLARLYNAVGKPELAIVQAEEYLVQKPDSAAALEAIGIAHGVRNQLQQAESYLLRALEREPNRVSAYLELTVLYRKQGQYEQARKLLEKAMALDPRNAKTLHLLADLERVQGRKENALTLYRQLESITPADPAPLYKAGLILLELGKTSAAESAADQILKKFPKSAEGFRLKGMAAYRSKRFPDAIAALQEANKLQGSISGFYFLGLSHYGQGELETALSQFRQILDRMPTFHQARLLSGMILLRQKRLDDAVAELTKVVQADGENALAHNILGSAYMAKGMYSEGMKELDLATRLDPKLVETHLKKGLFHLSQGKTAEVEADLVAAVRVAPEALNTRLVLGSFYLHKKNPTKALAVLKQGLSGKSDDAVLYSAMAKIMFSQNKRSEAVAYLNKAKVMNPDTLDPYYTLASYYSAAGDTASALKEYGQVLRKQPSELRANLHVAALLELDGKDKEALSFLERAKRSSRPEAYQALIGFYERRGDARQALAVTGEGLKSNPRSTAILEQKVLLHLKEKQYRAALSTVDDIDAFDPEQSSKLRVAAYISMQKLPEAAKQAERIIAQKPDAAVGYMLLASVYKAQGKSDLAINALKKGLARDSSHPQAALMLAGLYATSGNHALAQSTCDEIIRQVPSFAPAYHAQGSFYEAQGNRRGAAEKYRAALAISDRFVPALNNLAVLCADGYGSPGEALILAEAAFTLEPANPAVIDTFGYSLYKNGRYSAAARMLEKAEALLPGNPTVNFHLALVHQAMGEKRQAVTRLKKALLRKDFPEANQAGKLLADLS